MRTALALTALLLFAASANAGVTAWMEVAENYWNKTPCGGPTVVRYDEPRKRVLGGVDTLTCEIRVDRDRFKNLRPRWRCDLIVYAWRALLDMPPNEADPFHEIRGPWWGVYEPRTCRNR